jgi:mannose-6-phosphate isomerase-like protein (cupin superfamily)
MDAFELHELDATRQERGELYLEFLRVPSMSMGLYVLPAGGIDPQQPHTEDEVYVVMNGRGQIRCGDEDRPVQAGSVVFVPAKMVHYFHSIVEDLHIYVCFSPAEYSLREQ